MANRGRENLILHGERFGSIPWLLESRRCSSYPIREPKKLASLGREIEPILCRIPPVLRDERNVTRVQVPSASCLLHWVSYPPTLGAWRGSAMRPECPELRGCYLAAAQLEQLKARRDAAETELRWHMSRRHRLFRAMVPGPWSPCPASGHTNLPHSGLNGTESATGLNHVEGRKTRPPRRAAHKRKTHTGWKICSTWKESIAGPQQQEGFGCNGDGRHLDDIDTLDFLLPLALLLRIADGSQPQPTISSRPPYIKTSGQ